MKQDFSGLKLIKVALLGDSATQLLVTALRGTGYDQGFDLDIFEAGFNQIEHQVFDPGSELYSFAPDVIIIFRSSHKLLGQYNKLKPEQFSGFADAQMDLIHSLHDNIAANSTARIIFYNYPEINDPVFGSYANKTDVSFLFQLRKLNYLLMLHASQNANFYLCDLSAIQNQYGKAYMFDTSVYINTDMVLSIDALPPVAAKTLDIIGALHGKFKKCVVVDLDNTLWGGIIGDDGLENIQIGSLGIGKAFTEFQYWLKKLKYRGIILAVCSKNTEHIAKQPFDEHPDMVLHLDDIALFVANWENKADNIKYIQQTLNIGFDSMVFLDDNPFERDIVRENLPGVTVPELPEDPADYLEYLYSLNLFETASYSNQDAGRTQQYRTEAKRLNERSGYINEDDFLKGLNMVSLVEPFNKFNGPRVAQLSQRSNQFNLRTVRYTEADIERLSGATDRITFSYTLEDKFGDNGLISVVILEKESVDILLIDTWIMSCRVLKRGMESFVLNSLVDTAKKQGAKYLKGEYIATPKNDMVKHHYPDLGFTPLAENTWLLDVDTYQIRENFIGHK